MGKIISREYFKTWKSMLDIDIDSEFKAIQKMVLEPHSFTFYTSVSVSFYYESFMHLAFVNLHPFGDGNGRIARLLEKWFLSKKLGERAWYMQSEKQYYKSVDSYYKNLARLGIFYEELDYEKSLPFLLMLPQSIIFEK